MDFVSIMETGRVWQDLLRQMLPAHDSAAPSPAPGWQQWLFLAFLPLDRANEGAHRENLFPSSGSRLPRSRCCCPLPFLVRRGQPQR